MTKRIPYFVLPWTFFDVDVSLFHSRSFLCYIFFWGGGGLPGLVVVAVHRFLFHRVFFVLKKKIRLSSTNSTPMTSRTSKVTEFFFLFGTGRRGPEK